MVIVTDYYWSRSTELIDLLVIGCKEEMLVIKASLQALSYQENSVLSGVP